MFTSIWARALLWQLLLPAVLVSASGRSGYNSVDSSAETTDSGRSGYNGVNETVSISSGRSGYNKIKRERTGQWTPLDGLLAEWSTTGAGVFVMDSGSPCDNADIAVPRYLDEVTADAMGSCFKDRQYYLVQAGALELGGGKFSIPMGWESVTPTSVRAAILRQLVIGAVRTSETDGGRHDSLKARDTGSESDSDSAEEHLLLTSIYIRLPVCGPAEALENWKRAGDTGTRSARFPCNE